GLTALTPDQHEVTIDLWEASQASGRVVDSEGNPLGGRRVQIRMDRMGDDRTLAHIFNHGRTDERGRYTFAGLVVNSTCEVMTSHRNPESDDGGGLVEVHKFVVRGPDPISLPDLVIPIEIARRVAAAEERRPAASTTGQALSRPPTTPSSPSLAE